MKKYAGLFIFCLSFLTFSPALLAQNPNTELSKSEVKKWKKIAKQYAKSPITLKLLTEEHSYLKKNSVEWQAEINRLKEMLAAKNETGSTQMLAVEQLKRELSSTQAALQQLQLAAAQNMDDVGTWFRVQIGAYEHEQLDPTQLNTDKLSVEAGALQRIVLGRYRNYEEAKQLRDSLRKLGLKDAWIVSYRDGKRVSIEEAIRN
jgi:hypothetical protein